MSRWCLLMLLFSAILAVTSITQVEAERGTRNVLQEDATMDEASMSLAEIRATVAGKKGGEKILELATSGTNDAPTTQDKADTIAANLRSMIKSMTGGKSIQEICGKTGGIKMTTANKALFTAALNKMKTGSGVEQSPQGKEAKEAAQIFENAKTGSTIDCSVFDKFTPKGTPPADAFADDAALEKAGPDDLTIQLDKIASDPYSLLSENQLNPEIETTSATTNKVKATYEPFKFPLGTPNILTEEVDPNAVVDAQRALIASSVDYSVEKTNSNEYGSLIEQQNKGIWTDILWGTLIFFLFAAWLFLAYVCFPCWLLLNFVIFCGWARCPMILILLESGSATTTPALPAPHAYPTIAPPTSVMDIAMVESYSLVTRKSIEEYVGYCASQLGNLLIKNRYTLALFALGYLPKPEDKRHIKYVSENYYDFSSHAIRNALLASNVYTGWPKLYEESFQDNRIDHARALFRQNMVTLSGGMGGLFKTMRTGLKLDNGYKYPCKFMLVNIQAEGEEYPVAIQVTHNKKYLVLFSENRVSHHCSMKCFLGHCSKTDRAMNALKNFGSSLKKLWETGDTSFSDMKFKDATCAVKSRYQPLKDVATLRTYLFDLLKIPAGSPVVVEAKVAYTYCDQAASGCSQNVEHIIKSFKQKFPKEEA